MSKTALVTGITGQDGAYLSRELLDRGFSVFGGVRRTSSDNTWRLEELGIAREAQFVDFDLVEITNIIRAIEHIRPSEIYNLAAQSFVRSSFEQPIYTAETDALGAVRILEAVRQIDPKIRFYQASTSRCSAK
jgi:GDPmannose 4,6-dehydratase